MAYIPLQLAAETPPNVRAVIVRTIETLRFSDVRTMLRLPQKQYDLEAGCNFAISQTLLAVIGGVSAVVYAPDETNDNVRFFLKEFYPWNDEPSQKEHA